MGSIHKLFTRFRGAVQEIWILSLRIKRTGRAAPRRCSWCPQGPEVLNVLRMPAALLVRRGALRPALFLSAPSLWGGGVTVLRG